jgi:hypothetical protein
LPITKKTSKVRNLKKNSPQTVVALVKATAAAAAAKALSNKNKYRLKYKQ